MVLAGLVGYLLERLAGLEHLLVPALLLGFLVASVVPAGGNCAPGPARGDRGQPSERR